jgi:hypothetical protein
MAGWLEGWMVGRLEGSTAMVQAASWSRTRDVDYCKRESKRHHCVQLHWQAGGGQGAGGGEWPLEEREAVARLRGIRPAGHRCGWLVARRTDSISVRLHMALPSTLRMILLQPHCQSHDPPASFYHPQYHLYISHVHLRTQSATCGLHSFFQLHAVCNRAGFDLCTAALTASAVQVATIYPSLAG